MTVKLIDASTANTETSSTAYTTTPVRIAGYKVFTCKISATATIVLQGRMHADDDWHTIETYVASGEDMVALFPQMRTTLADNNGTVSAWLDV